MPKDLAQSILEGSRLALARTLTLVENDHPDGWAALNILFPHTGRAHLVGITGPPGTGKSSLVNQIALYFRRPPEDMQSSRVAVVAVDPTSPFSGGAILGDRIRMRDLSGDPGVFIRSMASRGNLGGLAGATASVVQVLDAAGFDLILIETVGAGQDEVEIARLAHTTLVVEAPGLGDDIQAIKAGILEIADILVINKADRPGVEVTERALRGMLELGHPVPRGTVDQNISNESQVSIWLPPIQRTVAVAGEGIPELAAQVLRHRAYLEETGGWSQRERERLLVEFNLVLRETLLHTWMEENEGEMYRRTVQALFDRQISPRQAAIRLVRGT